MRFHIQVLRQPHSLARESRLAIGSPRKQPREYPDECWSPLGGSRKGTSHDDRATNFLLNQFRPVQATEVISAGVDKVFQITECTDTTNHNGFICGGCQRFAIDRNASGISSSGFVS